MSFSLKPSTHDLEIKATTGIHVKLVVIKEALQVSEKEFALVFVWPIEQQYNH